MSLTKVSYSMIQGAVYSVLDYGIVADGLTNNSSAITTLIDTVSTAGGGVIFFPAGTYAITSQINLKGNVTLKGEGRTSVIKATATGGYYMLNASAANADNVTIDGLCFDGSSNYPANEITTDPRTYANWNVAIRTGGVSTNNFKVVNCYFRMLAGGAMDFRYANNNNIVIQNNDFYKAGYTQWQVNIRSTVTNPTETDRPSQILIEGNTFYGGGPQSWYDPSSDSWASSVDAICIDRCKNFVVSNNLIQNCAGIGVRVEESIWGTVVGNEIYNSGGPGINCYKNSYYITVTGNMVKGWGRIPPTYAIRNYSGTYVYAKEFPDSVHAPLPSNPTLSTWFATWPYDLTNVDTSKIIVYSNTQYYPSTNGILPFRGYGAIMVNQESANCVVSGNNCIGNTEQVGGKYTHASNFGYTNVHPVNGDSVTNNGNRCRVVGNYFGDVLNYGVYAPIYQDPINSLALMGTGEYNGNFGASEAIQVFEGNARASNFYLTPDLLITSGAAAPTTGSWARGSIVWNTAPSSGGPPGWVCVTAGSPGTWKAMANLA